MENRTSGAEALSNRILYGTAEAMPFVQGERSGGIYGFLRSPMAGVAG